jgi:nicotinamidase-related amidase
MRRLGSSRHQQWQVSETAADLRRPKVAQHPVTFRARPQNLTIDLSRTALIIIDMQNDFCASDGWLASIGVDIAAARRPIGPLNTLTAALRPAQVPILWVNWGNRPDLLNLSPALLHVYKPSGVGIGLSDPLTSGARVLERGSASAAIVAGLDVAPTDIHIAKMRMSGFWDTELDSVLRNLGVTTLLFGGVNADQCVLATLMDANFLGYDCILLEDGAATTSPGFCWDATLYNVRQCFGFTAIGTDIADSLQSFEERASWSA